MPPLDRHIKEHVSAHASLCTRIGWGEGAIQSSNTYVNLHPAFIDLVGQRKVGQDVGG